VIRDPVASKNIASMGYDPDTEPWKSNSARERSTSIIMLAGRSMSS